MATKLVAGGLWVGGNRSGHQHSQESGSAGYTRCVLGRERTKKSLGGLCVMLVVRLLLTDESFSFGDKTEMISGSDRAGV